MNEAPKRLESFEKSWREPLQSCAQVAFHYRAREHTMGAPARVADDFVARCGYKSIGFHWELLDPLAERTGDRSALGAFEDALAKGALDTGLPIFVLVMGARATPRLFDEFHWPR